MSEIGTLVDEGDGDIEPIKPVSIVGRGTSGPHSPGLSFPQASLSRPILPQAGLLPQSIGRALGQSALR